jgi:phosphoglycerol transferase MdoB-like AlkP superfamily enzyme
MFTVMRIIFWRVFNDPNDVVPYPVLLNSCYIGLKFDLRLTLFLHLPLLLLAWIKHINIFSTTLGRRLWGEYLIVANAIILLFYFTDFGHYAYLESRMDATVLRFLYNPQISFQMVWESYPVFGFVALFAFLILIYGFFIKWILRKFEQSETPALPQWKKIVLVTVSIFIYTFGIYGKLSYYPLRWSDAFFSTYSFASALSLNPVLFFFDTLKNREVKYDIDKVRKCYDTVAAYLGVTYRDKDRLNFIRIKENEGGELKRPNVVIVFLESFAYYKTSFSGNPLNPTPNIYDRAKDSILFTRFYTPHGGTARSVFTTITGMPDVELIKTSSRNPLVVSQHTIINAFEGYEKFYFLGGSLNWAELRGLLSHNLPRLHVYEEGSYTSPRADVWGISDLHLFEEANWVFRDVRDKPFFAIIQTSGNHRPYTIPEDNRGFQLLSPSEDDAVTYGFESVAGFNSIRFMDHSIKFFLDAAKKDGYLNNTIFVFLGDHGSGRRHPLHMHKAEDQLELTKYHVPLVIYAPGLIKEGKVYDKVASEVDILPTIAGITSIPYVNSTFGRDLLDDRFDAQRYAFTIRHWQVPYIGLIGDKFYFSISADGTNGRLNRYYSDDPTKNIINEFQEVAAEMEQLCRGIYETVNYMRYHNSPETVAAKVNLIK